MKNITLKTSVFFNYMHQKPKFKISAVLKIYLFQIACGHPSDRDFDKFDFFNTEVSPHRYTYSEYAALRNTNELKDSSYYCFQLRRGYSYFPNPFIFSNREKNCSEHYCHNTIDATQSALAISTFPNVPKYEGAWM